CGGTWSAGSTATQSTCRTVSSSTAVKTTGSSPLRTPQCGGTPSKTSSTATRRTSDGPSRRLLSGRRDVLTAVIDSESWEDPMPGTKPAVNKIANVVVPVADQDKVVAFYVDTLGLEKRVDVPFENRYRWVEVGLPGQDTTIALAPPPPGGSAGKRQTGISLQ